MKTQFTKCILTLLLILCAGTLLKAQTSESFEGYWTNDVTFSPNPATYGPFVYSSDGNLETLISPAGLDIGSANAGTFFSIKKSGGGNFEFVNFQADLDQSIFPSGTTVSVTGFVGGVAITNTISELVVGSQTNYDFSAVPGFNNVDEVRITGGLHDIFIEGWTYFLNPPATISSISLTGSSVTNAATVNYTATFGSAVAGLAAGNFTINASGVSGASAGAPTTGDGGITWTVPVSTGAGDGTIQLQLDNGTGSSGFTTALPFSGDTYTIDKTPPTIAISAPSVTSTTTGGSASYTVTYADANFNTSTLGLGDITLNTSGTANGAIGLTGSGGSYTVTISGVTGNGTLCISIDAGTASDNAGNTAPASGASATFNVLSNDAALANFTISNGTLVPGFSPGTFNYNTTIANFTSVITVVPTTDDPNATVAVDGSPVTSGVRTSSIPMNVGANTLTIVVTAQDGVTFQTYTITINRSLPNNALLTSIALDPKATLVSAAGHDYLDLTAAVINSTSSIKVLATAQDGLATITVNGQPVTSGSLSQSILLNPGTNTITTVITAEDGSTIKTAVITVNRAGTLPTNALLTSIALGPKATLVGTAGHDYLDLTAAVTNSTGSVQVLAIAQDRLATITVNGKAVTSGSLSQSIPLNVGANTITTVITAEDGSTTKTAVITVNRAASAVANLANLTISQGTLSPAFTSSTLSYSSSEPYQTASVTLTPTTTDPNATVTVNGNPASTVVALTIGLNKIVTKVTAQNGITISTYTTYITRAAPSTNALYTSIALGLVSTLVGTTGPGYLNFKTNVAYGESSVQVVVTAKDPTATISVNDSPAISGIALQPIALNVGNNTITTVITAQDGLTTKTAIITVTRAALVDNNIYQQISVTKPANQVTIDDGITVHQALSPNGDGINDYLTIDGIANHPDNRLMIMDRNGVMVYQTKGYDNSSKLFDGHSNINGKMQLPGTYFYSLDYTVNGDNKHKTGYIILKY